MPDHSIENLYRSLRKPSFLDLICCYFSITTLSTEDAIIESVDRSTIRAYHNTKCYRPLSLYRSWAASEATVSDWHCKLLKAAESVDSYRQFHAALCCSLHFYWAHYDASSVPNYGRKRKLIDLFMKHILLTEGIDLNVRKKLNQLVHVPLDKYTLKHLSGLVAPELPRHKWTMGTVNQENYLLFQDLIRDIACAAAVPPIAFDIYAWNSEHSAATKKFIEKWNAKAKDRSASNARCDKRPELKLRAHNTNRLKF